jgi:multiple sugar transport system ATP-binding protein
VAGFIGSPSMNFLSGELREGRVRLPFGDIPVPADVQHKGNVVAGLRPEDFEDAALSTDTDGVTLRTNVDLLMSMGSEYHAHFEVESERRVLRAVRRAGRGRRRGGPRR